MKRLKKVFVSFVALTIALSFCACGSSNSKSAYDSYVSNSAASVSPGFYDYAGETFESEAAAGSTSYNSSEDNTKLNDSARKLIKTYNISLETENFDDLIPSLEAKIASVGGYIQNLETYNGSNYSNYRSNRYSSITVRVPSVNLEAFVQFVGDSSNVTNKTLSVEDVTLQYVDTESRKKTYEIEQERLLALLEKCESVEDMITIESRLSEVRYNLESQESVLRTYDNLVDYSTVYLYVSEVVKYSEPEPEGYGEQVARAFAEGVSNVVDFLKEFLVEFVGAIPALCLLAVLVVIVVFIVKAISKSRKKSTEKKKNKRSEEMMQQAQNTASEKAKKNAE